MASIEQIYQSKTEREHVLARPDTYVGSIVTEKREIFHYAEKTEKIENGLIDYNPAFFKLFDEILSNSVDQSRKNPKCNTIKVTVDDTTISVYDNGGIPVEMHKDAKMYVPEFCFSQMRAGSNFNDDEKRTTVGTNGFGATLVNILSKEFIIETCDGKKKFKQVFSDNMSNKTKPSITITNSRGFTKITYKPDLSYFKLKKIGADEISLIHKRVLDAAACNPKVKFYYNGKQVVIDTFEAYARLYTNDDVFVEENKNWSVAVAHSDNGFQNISFVNGVATYDGGTHVDYIANQIIEHLRERVSKKYKYDLKPADIKNQLMLFINCTIINPRFTGQVKEKLSTGVKDFGSTMELSEKFLKAIYNSEITKSLIDWIDRKKIADENAAVRQANKEMKKIVVDKLIDCKLAGSTHKNKTCLIISEGDSASSGFRKFRDPQTQALFPIRGKILNVRDITNDKVRANEEIKGIMNSLGLQFGKSPFKYDDHGRMIEDNMRIHEVRIMTDADTDGSNIAALLVNIFEKFWPELFKEHRIARIETPILIAEKGSKKEVFYYQSEYEKWCKRNDPTKWKITYYKGLAALEDDDYEKIICTPKMYYYNLDAMAHEELEIWFGKDSSKRKEKLI